MLEPVGIACGIIGEVLRTLFRCNINLKNFVVYTSPLFFQQMGVSLTVQNMERPFFVNHGVNETWILSN